jgi:Tol biopolymer transport system component
VLTFSQRGRVRAALLTCAAVVACVVAPTSADAEMSRVVFDLDKAGFYTATEDGGNLTPIPGTAGDAYHTPALSPDGQRIVYTNGYKLFISFVDGTRQRVVYDTGATAANPFATIYMPEWAPDGRSIVFQHTAGAATRWDIARVNEDGTGMHFIVRWPGNQEQPDISADGRKIAFESDATPAGDLFRNSERAIYTVEANGTAPVRVTKSDSTVSAAFEPSFSPSGSEIAYEGRKASKTNDGLNYDIFVTGASGTNVNRRNLTNDNIRDGAPDWHPEGTKIMYAGSWPSGSIYGWDYEIRTISPSGSGKTTMMPFTENRAWYLSSYRASSTTITKWDFLAYEHRPTMLFDEGERWRPLDVTKFFAERHTMCSRDGLICEPIGSAELLRNPIYHDGVLDVNGTPGQEETYHSPNPNCLVDNLRDCDFSPESASYYHVVGPSPLGYTYLDYWYFYRYNDNPDPSGFDHESDWEGLSIAPAPAPRQTFDFASFSGHGTYFSYLRDNLSCDGLQRGSCGTEQVRMGMRVNSYIAGGSHANYAEPCGNFCFQSNSVVPEMDHGGERPWGRNDDRSALLKLPPNAPLGTPWASGPKEFTDWPGNWTGTPDHQIFGPAGGDPNRAHFFAPWDGLVCVDDDTCSAQTASARRTQRARTTKNASCRSWFGPSVNVLACDERGLERALRDRTLGKRGNVAVTAGRSSADDAPGLAQVLGPPLRPGAVARVVRRSGAAAEHRVLVRIRNRRGDVFVAEFERVGGGRGVGRLRVAAPAGARAASRQPPQPTITWSNGSADKPSAIRLERRARP